MSAEKETSSGEIPVPIYLVDLGIYSVAHSAFYPRLFHTGVYYLSMFVLSSIVLETLYFMGQHHRPSGMRDHSLRGL